MIKWPEILPLPTIDSYGISPSDAIIRTEMEQGPARQRRRFTDTPTKITVRWIMTPYQYTIFDGWYCWKAEEGGSWFSIRLLLGLGLIEQQARFISQYEAKLIGNTRWEITAMLEIKQRSVLSRDVVEILQTENPDGLISAVNNFNNLINNISL